MTAARLSLHFRSVERREEKPGDASFSSCASPEESRDDSCWLNASHSYLTPGLERLTEIDPRKSRVIELRFFGGLSVEETSEVLNVSPQTVMRDWKLAKAWLYQEIKSETRDEV